MAFVISMSEPQKQVLGLQMYIFSLFTVHVQNQKNKVKTKRQDKSGNLLACITGTFGNGTSHADYVTALLTVTKSGSATDREEDYVKQEMCMTMLKAFIYKYIVCLFVSIFQYFVAKLLTSNQSKCLHITNRPHCDALNCSTERQCDRQANSANR